MNLLNTLTEKLEPAKQIGHDTGMLLIRLMVGTVFVFHGSGKLFGWFEGPGIEGFTGYLTTLGVPFPELNAYAAALTEFGGGLLLILGVASRLISLPLVFVMGVAVVTAKSHAFSNLAGGMEYPLTLGIVLLGIALVGPGRFTTTNAVRVPPDPVFQTFAPTPYRNPKPKHGDLTMTDSNVRIAELIEYIQQGKILEGMEEFYADNVVMTEPYHSTEGKAENIEREKEFLAGVKEWRNFEVKATAIDGNTSLSEQVMDWTTTDGQDIHVEQIAVARWENGKIVHERFYYSTN